MRDFNRTYTTEEDDDDDDAVTVNIIDEILPSQEMTLNELVMIYAIFIGTILYCCKNQFCKDSWGTRHYKFDHRKVYVQTDLEVADIWQKGDDEPDKVETLNNVREDIDALKHDNKKLKRRTVLAKQIEDLKKSELSSEEI